MIKLVKPEFIVGTEKRFANFISSLNSKDKIACVSHGADLDGIASAKVVSQVVNGDIIRLEDYQSINEEFVLFLKRRGINKVIFSDMKLEVETIREIEKFAEILVIDHHKIDVDFNSAKTVFLNAHGFCAGYLCYYLFSKVQDLTKLDWLVASSCISDFCHIAPWDWLAEVFRKYGDKLEGDGKYVRKSGVIWDLQFSVSLALVYYRETPIEVYNQIGTDFGDIGNLAEKAEEVDRYLGECLQRFEKEKQEFASGEGYFWEFKPKFRVGSMACTIKGFEHPDKNVLVAWEIGEFYYLSARRQDKLRDMDLLMKKLVAGLHGALGGGHAAAAGAHSRLMDREEIKRRLGLKQ